MKQIRPSPTTDPAQVSKTDDHPVLPGRKFDIYRLLLIVELILLVIALLYFMDGLRDLMRYYYNPCSPVELIWL